MNETKEADLVLEGGGVKGIGLAGALKVLEANHYTFKNIVGTSAGAIVGALVAVGFTADEIEEKLKELEFKKFKDKNEEVKASGFAKLLSTFVDTLTNYGIYKGDYFENWITTLLESKGKTRFSDIALTEKTKSIYAYQFQAIATDLTDRKLLVLPRDLAKLGLDVDQFSIAQVVRMSMSIPIYFEPVRLKDSHGKEHIIVDGGVLSNYPIWLLDDGTANPPWPTIGLKLVGSDEIETASSGPEIKDPVGFLKGLVSTMIVAHDKYHVSRSRGDFDRTVFIPTYIDMNGEKKDISTFHFEITEAEENGLFQNGMKAAEKWIENWDFETWCDNYRRPQ